MPSPETSATSRYLLAIGFAVLGAALQWLIARTGRTTRWEHHRGKRRPGQGQHVHRDQFGGDRHFHGRSPPGRRRDTTSSRNVLVADDNQDAADSLAVLLQTDGSYVNDSSRSTDGRRSG